MFLLNKQMRAEQIEKLSSFTDAENPVLFAIVGDVSGECKYSQNTLVVCGSYVYTYDFTKDELGPKYYIKDIAKVYNKRMYGNAVMRIEMVSGEKHDLFRYTFAVAGLCDSASYFITSVHDGMSVEEAFGSVEATYEKLLSICPKCGRTLSAPGVKCINCEGKRKLIKKLVPYIAPEMKVLIISVFLSIFTTALALLPPYLTKSLVDDILPNKDLQALMYVVVLLLSLYVVRITVDAIRGYMLRVCGNKIVARIKCDVFYKSQYLPMRFYDKTSTGAVINRINGDSNTIQAFMLRITQEVVVQFFTMIGIVVVMLIMDPTLTLLSLLPVPFVVIFAKWFARKMGPFYSRIWRRGSAVSSVLTDTLPGIRVIKSFTNEENSGERFHNVVEEWRITDNKAGKMLSIHPAIINLLVYCGTLVIWGLGGYFVINGTGGSMTPGLLVSFISYASMFYGPVSFFAYLSDSYQSALAAAERIMDILDAEPEHNFGKGNCLEKIDGKIEFKNVNFSFDRTKKVLKNINLTIEPGDIVGIVGTTGSGKSTLINLLMRYYDHYEGEILLDGVNIRDIDMEYYRSRIGFVQQEPMMFHDTIFNNIAYGDTRYSVEQVIAAADIANAHEFIVRQPDGYDSVLGERGVGLSGGERQRVSIARAVLKNPSLLIFDEATAAVDSETEHLIQEAIERLISGRTTLMIAHRLSTLSKANKIVVVDNGEIIECGAPEELMAMKGKYYRLVQIQTMSDKIKEDKEKERFE